MKLGRAVVASIIASSASCGLFVDLDGLSGGESGVATADGSLVDAAVSDGATRDGGQSADASVDTGTRFDCASLDATFCDAFERDAAVTSGSPWASIQTTAGCTLKVDGRLTTAYPATSDYSLCYLQSSRAANSRTFTLEFDTTFATTDTADNAQIVLAGVDLDLATVNDAGQLSVSFQLLLDGSGFSTLGMIPYYPDASVSPQPGNSYPFYALAQADKFLQKATPCHVSVTVDALAPSATVSSKCDGLLAVDMTRPSGSVPKIFTAPPTVLLGYTDTGGSALAAWSLTYDNMVFRRAP